MTSLGLAETALRWIGVAVGIAFHVPIFYRLIRGLIRGSWRSVGVSNWRHGPWVAIVSAVIFPIVVYLLWRPIPIALPAGARWAALIGGSLLYFPGVALMTWGRLSLDEDHRLVTSGPYAFVRHPVYLGHYLAIGGGLLLFQTWLMLVFVGGFQSLPGRARREDEALAAEFGDEWIEYARRVPAWIPRMGGSKS